jgi:hypothetical protein
MQKTYQCQRICQARLWTPAVWEWSANLQSKRIAMLVPGKPESVPSCAKFRHTIGLVALYINVL